MHKTLLNITLLGLFVYGWVTQVEATELQLQNGDLIFQTLNSEQSYAIQLATHSKYSHVGIIYQKNQQFFVYEAIQPVQLTPLSVWIQRGENQHFVVKRLKQADAVLTDKTLARMKQVGEQYLGKPYDVYFGWSDERIYCSELVWKIYQQAAGIEIGQLAKLSSFDLEHPLVQKKLEERYGKNIPFDEWVISPAAMFHSKQLMTVVSQ